MFESRNAPKILGAALLWSSIVGVPLYAQATFSDQTVSSGLVFTPSLDDSMAGVDMDIGGTVGDFDNDGFPDVFLLGGGGVADALFINNGDGTFTDQAASWGVAVLHRGHAATAGDYDGDGRQDIFVTSSGDMSDDPRVGQHRLYRNNGNGTFSEVAGTAGVNETSTTALVTRGAAFGDYDLDGDLDLFVCTWMDAFQETDGNRLFENNGDGTFSDATVAAGVMALDIHGFSPSFADMDGDLYPELLIAADYSSSRYFVNDTDGTFTDATSTSGTSEDNNGMGSAIGDLNNDGLFEWFVTSIYFNVSPPNNGNYLYINQGGHLYQAVQPIAVIDGGWGWGTAACDFDHDGFVDLAETNGWKDLEWEVESAYLYMNNGDPDASGIMTFTESHVTAGLMHTLQGRALLSLDYDRDGDMDLVITASNGSAYLFRNDITGAGTHWLEVVLDTSGDPGVAPNGFGTRLVATTGSVSRSAYVHGGASYLGRSQLVAHFGLENDAVIDQLDVYWGNGTTTTLTGLASDQILTLGPPIAGASGEASSPETPAEQMRAAHDDASGWIDVSYTVGCNATNHRIYHGDLASVGSYAWSGTVCGVGNSGAAAFDPGPGDSFFVVVATTGVVEGSYGKDSSGTERPEDTATPGCDLAQVIATGCPP